MSDSTTISAARTTARRPRIIGIGVVVAGAILGVVGLLCPWATISADFAGVEESGNGFDPDFFGVPILLALAVGVVAAVATLRARFAALLTMLSAATVSLLAIAGNAKVGNTRSEMEALGAQAAADAVSTGIGVWLTLLAGVVMLVGAVLAIRKGGTAS